MDLFLPSSRPPTTIAQTSNFFDRPASSSQFGHGTCAASRAISLSCRPDVFARISCSYGTRLRRCCSPTELLVSIETVGSYRISNDGVSPGNVRLSKARLQETKKRRFRPLSGSTNAIQIGQSEFLGCESDFTVVPWRESRIRERSIKVLCGLDVAIVRKVGNLRRRLSRSRCGYPQFMFVHFFAATRSDIEAEASIDGTEDERHRGSKNNDDSFSTSDSDSVNEMLRLMKGSKDYYPMVRTYQNDLCTLELCGSAKGSQVLAAMASDRSYTAATNLIMGRPLTVLQTVLPGSSGNHSTISTKLFAPSSLVIESAKKLTMPNGVGPKDFGHRLFEAVQMLNLSKFYVEFHANGRKRNMAALAREEKDEAIIILESSDKEALDELARTIALYAIACMKERNSSDDFESYSWSYAWKTSQKREWCPSSQAAVRICTLSTSEMSTEANSLLECMPLREASIAEEAVALEAWWPAPASLKNFIKQHLGSRKEQWAYDYLPAHRLHINLNLLSIKVTGGQRISHQVQELLLSHAQLTDIAGVLDLYYGDIFTLPNKRLNTGVLLDFYNFSRSKLAQSLEGVSIVGLVLGAAIFAWLVVARLKKTKLSVAEMQVDPLKANTVTLVDSPKVPRTLHEFEPMLPINEEVSASEMETLCRLVVSKVQEAFKWHGQIQSSAEKGAWMGQDCCLPTIVKAERRRMEVQVNDKNIQEFDVKDNPDWSIVLGTDVQEKAAPNLIAKEDGYLNLSGETSSNVHLERPLSKIEEAEAPSREDALMYQVVLSRNGDVMGFLPLNQAAVMHWARMPFAEVLHKGNKLRPGFFERPIKYRGPPRDAVAIELLILNDPMSPIVSARPFQM